MRRLDFRLPDVGEGVTEGEIVKWLVRTGDLVSEDDPMVEIMTDKATVTIGAPCDGRVAALCFEPGAVAKVGQVIVTLEPTGDVVPAAASSAPEPPSSGPSATAVGEIADRLPGSELLTRGVSSNRPLATPAVRRLSKELGVDLAEVRPTGPGERITADDVRSAAQLRRDAAAPGREERVPIVGIRRRIAERMQQATRTAAHFTFVEECSADALDALRERLRPEAERRGVKLTFLPFVIKAVADVLQRHPLLNASVDEQARELILKKHYDIGVATATDAGLIVPVVHGADELGVFDIAAQVDRLAGAARAGTLEPKDLQGSTFTVTSLGKQSGLFATPILNHPEVAILGVHRIKERPVVRDGEVAVGRVMLLSLSFDHRVVDGHVGAAFAYDLIETLEHPERLLVEPL